MYVAEIGCVEREAPALVSRRYSDYRQPPSTEQLARFIIADPDGTLPLWEETDEILAAPDWSGHGLEHPEALMAMRSENYALLAVVLNEFSRHLQTYRADNPPFGLQGWVPGLAARVPVRQDQARPDLDWVTSAISDSTFNYVGEYLEQGRQGRTPYTAAFKRLAVMEDFTASWRSEQHALPRNASTVDVKRDESQVHINAGLSTAAEVNRNLLMHIEGLLSGTVTNTDAALIAKTARNSYGLPLAMARLSIGSSLSFGELLKTSEPLTLSQNKVTPRVRFVAPPEKLIQKLSGFTARDPSTLGCPANVKIGERMTTALWNWAIDVAEQSGVWETGATLR